MPAALTEVCDTLGRTIDPKRLTSVMARRRARSEGHRYYLGNPCGCCGGLLRYTNCGNCVRCKRAKSNSMQVSGDIARAVAIHK